MANNGAFALTASSTKQTIAEGYYSGGTLPAASSTDLDLTSDNVRDGIDIFGVIGNMVAGWLYGDNDDPAQVLTTAGNEGDGSGGGTFNVTNLSNAVIKKGITWGAGLGETGLFYGDTDAWEVLTTADDGGAAKGTYNASNLSTTTVKKGTAFGVSETGAYSGYPGSGANRADLTQATCAVAANWYWFEDGNGDGDSANPDDPEDGICVYANTAANMPVAGSWNGYDSATNYDSTYIAAYTCDGVSFPNGNVATYSGIASTNYADTTWNEVDCALCKADCLDGVKDLPDNGGYKPSPGDGSAPGDGTATGDYNGPLTPKVLAEWKGTRLPTSADFFGFCGYKDGVSNYENTTSVSSSDKTFGNYGVQVGRTDEFLDLADNADSFGWEWLSEQHYGYARVAGSYACSYFLYGYVYTGYSFRAVFRPCDFPS